MTQGFRPEPRVYSLAFPDHPDVAGLEVRLRSMSVGERLEFDRMRFTAPATVAQRLAKEHAIAQALAERLLSWNLCAHPDGAPVPATLEGILAQEDWVIAPILQAWIDAITGVRRPLDREGGMDGTQVMDSIPVAPLTPDSTS